MHKCLKVYMPGERLWMWRRCGRHTQAHAAAFLGVCRTTYWRGEAYGDLFVQAPSRREWAREPGLPEFLALARRRAGWGTQGTADRLRVSRATLLQWEKQGEPRLIVFWKKRGFTFV